MPQPNSMSETLTHSYTHTLIHSYTHTLIHSHTHTLIHSYTHTHIHSYITALLMPCSLVCRLLASKNLPAAIEDTGGDSLPESIQVR